MYKTFTKAKSVLSAALLSVALLFSTSAMAGPGKPGDANIVQIALAVNEATGEFSTLLTAATCESLNGAVVGILTGEDKVTLFAPTDAAFGLLGLSAANVCDIPATNLLTILGYHVTDGRRFSNSLFNKNGNDKTVDMLIGGSITTYIGGMPAMPTIEDNQGNEIKVVGANINASNGVIHVVNAVLLP
jgi:uncharacterized surface protein with fasciclin (FAS1) repeats